MATLQRVVQWVSDVYQLATTDKVLGGALPAGISNQQAQELADRTEWLKDQLEKAQEALLNIHPIGEVQGLALAAFNAADYDATGLGLAGTPAEHWALCNSQNGTIDRRGAVTFGYDPDQPDYATVGGIGGSNDIYLQVDQLPPHRHTLNAVKNNGSVTYDAGSSGARAVNNANGGTGSTDTTGSNSPIDIRNKFVVLVYRQRVSN